MATNRIFVKGAREHNLKNIDVEFPRDKLVVITGLSGSGKSSLAFDTLYAEGQRRYVESLSAYARQFLELMEKPDVDHIEGLSPAVSIEQRNASRNPRSTVGTVTEIYDYMRLLYARVGDVYCCGRKLTRQTKEQITDEVLEKYAGKNIRILAPVVIDRKGEFQNLLDDLLSDGYTSAIVDGEERPLNQETPLEKYKKHSISAVVDSVTVSSSQRLRLAEAVESSLLLAKGVVEVMPEGGKSAMYSEFLACPTCGNNYPQLQPRDFSFNSPHGACPECQGLGTKMEFDEDLIIPDKTKSIRDGAIACWNSHLDGFYMTLVENTASHYGFNLNTPIKDLKPKHLQTILYGSGEEKIRFKHISRDGEGRWEYQGAFEGIIPNLARRHRETQSEDVREWLGRFMRATPCPACKGLRLKPESLKVQVAGKNIAETCKMSIKEAYEHFRSMQFSGKQATIARQILKEINARLKFLISVGLDYITLERASATLSGGEAQRIRLATQIGSQLMGVLYVLDEPSIGLHQRDNSRLLDTLKNLRDLGNTVVVVEHDRDTILSADWVVDLGPGAGRDGGYLIASCPPKQLLKEKKSITGKYLTNELTIPVPKRRREGNGKRITVLGAREHNLKNIKVEFPLGSFIGITGVSGSGKSTLINETLAKALLYHFYGALDKPGEHDKITGLENIDKVVVIDQSPIGRTPRSNPATYTGVFTPIRDLFAELPESRLRGYGPGRFSFNVKGGRCEACQGDGSIKVEMNFLPDVYVTCDVCRGKRYNPETLEVRYKNKTISDVLNMTAEEALEFFDAVSSVQRKLKVLVDVGLGYMQLGQPATTLSGGEAQRIKITQELGRRDTGRTLYILDEPTTGLHFHDIKKLLEVLNKLVDLGNTVIVIEHNLDVVKTCDFIVDLGPEGGDLGGSVVAAGTPEEVASNQKSYTGVYLAKVLESASKK
ncbi:UvrABC system protein A [uncultured archaeon]|nr:UvrABC system protein A [uncultured archaeon]